MATGPAIEVSSLTAKYGDETILDDVSFAVDRGEVFVVAGGSGCGKSTLLRHLVGLQRPYSGHVLVAGDDIARADEDALRAILRRVGVLFQSGALFGSMTLAENIALPLEEHTDLGPEAIRLLVQMKLQMVDLSGCERLLPSEISGGMRKRAALARALALDPDIVFLDEPSAGLDPVTSAEVDHLILQLRDSLGTTMVVVTHELASIFAIGDRLIMLDKHAKQIIAEGKPEELRDESANPRVRGFFNRAMDKE